MKKIDVKNFSNIVNNTCYITHLVPYIQQWN